MRSLIKTYARHSGDDDKEQKVMVIGVYNGCFLSNFIKRDHSFYNFLKGAI